MAHSPPACWLTFPSSSHSHSVILKIHCKSPGTTIIILPGNPESQGPSSLQISGVTGQALAAPPVYHTIPYHTIPYHTIPYHTIPYHTIPYHTIPHHTIPYHTTPHHTIPYHTRARIINTNHTRARIISTNHTRARSHNEFIVITFAYTAWWSRTFLTRARHLCCTHWAQAPLLHSLGTGTSAALIGYSHLCCTHWAQAAIASWAFPVTINECGKRVVPYTHQTIREWSVSQSLSHPLNSIEMLALTHTCLFV